MLFNRGVPIESPLLPVDALPRKPGTQVWDELGGRHLLRYLAPYQVGQFSRGSTRTHWATPTPYASEETVDFLYLPDPLADRRYVMLLDPRQMDEIRGPQWIYLGKGIQYFLPNGFPGEAVVGGWEMRIT